MTGNDFAERREIYCNNTIRQNGLVNPFSLRGLMIVLGHARWVD